VVAESLTGKILPTLITWAISTLPAAQRGTGTGLWMAASFLGQFLSPLVVLALRHATGSLSGAILVYALACAVSALTALACLIAVPRTPALSGTVPPRP
jgi:sugar phosphate permease